MKLIALFAATLAVSAPSMVHAQDEYDPAPGRQVVDPRGQYVATVVSVDRAAGTAVVDTGTQRGTVMLTTFGRSQAGPYLVTTRAQLDALIAQATAQANTALAAMLVAGASVYDVDGLPLGTVSEVTEEGMVLIDAEAGSFYLDRGGFYLDNGQVLASVTVASVVSQLAAL